MTPQKPDRQETLRDYAPFRQGDDAQPEIANAEEVRQGVTGDGLVAGVAGHRYGPSPGCLGTKRPLRESGDDQDLRAC